MKLDHVAIWTKDIEKMKEYYIRFFNAKSNELYINKTTGFKSYFFSFEDGARLEIMQRADIPENKNDAVAQSLGLIHIAFSVNTEEEVDKKAQELKDAGYSILRGPRRTGDGYYEFETLDPENNRLEVTTV